MDARLSGSSGDSLPSLEGELEHIVSECLERFFDEGEPALERACREHPERADAIREWVQSLFDMGLMHNEHFGPYRLVELLGEGGMGSVYLAEQSKPVRRRVALKVIKLGMDTKRVLRRFDAERQTLALMNHDNIAKVFDAGTTPRGQPYFVMEHVPGTPITHYCDEQRLSPRERVRLLQSVCAGVQHAHQKGVIHRDLKPANILVVRVAEAGPDGAGHGVPKIIDFGLARATDPLDPTGDAHGEAGEQTRVTVEGRMVGTPAYMSPEQADRTSAEVDTRTDIYSLGVILYELLVGELPIPSSEFQRASPAEVHRASRFQAPPRPSRRLSEQGAQSSDTASARRTTPMALARELRGDLDWIVMKAVEKDPARRYASASELAGDLQRFLDHEPVSAGPPGFGYRLRKFVRRNRLQVAAVAGVFLALIGGLFASLLFWIDARDARARAESALSEFDLLANEFKLAAAVEAENALYPAWPDSIPALEDWLHQHGEPLEAQLPELESALAHLQARASDLERDRFLEATLSELIGDLRTFVDHKVSGVRERIAWAQTVTAASIDQHAERWEEAIAAIATSDGQSASQHYRGLELAPQLGLVPLGPDPVTKFWEFYHLRSGTLEGAPERDEDGELPDLDPESGIVFVLLPAGTFLMGAQRESPGAPNYDVDSKPDEHFPHEVTLEAFFIAKHELSCAQWRALAGEAAPSYYTPDREVGDAGRRQRILWSNPVESVDWFACATLMLQHGLLLPTEAQWEYAARGGSDAAWWAGPDASAMDGGINLLDMSAQVADAVWEEVVPWLDDGYVVHAPVTSMRPNGFGLHHTLGNVWEWCVDTAPQYDAPARPGDGLRLGGPADRRTIRGGSYLDTERIARCAARGLQPPDGGSFSIGLRPARRIIER